MIAELQEMIGQGALRIIPADISTLLAKTVQTETRGRPETSGSTNSTSNEFLTAENDSLRLLLEQAGIDAKVLLAQAGIDAKEREAADKLQKLILEELHHRIKRKSEVLTLPLRRLRRKRVRSRNCGGGSDKRKSSASGLCPNDAYSEAGPMTALGQSRRSD
jgi:hypothetical protein